MNQRTFALIVFAFCLFLNNKIIAQWSNGQNASYVIGQPNFTSNTASLTQIGMDDPEGIAVDLINHKLYVADGNDHRILRYNLPITSNQPAAEIVFGQPTFTSDNSATTQNGLRDPRGVWVDSSGRLWVADFENNRVVWYDNAHSISTNQPNANGVLGQPNFTSNAPSLTQASLNGPCDLVTDPSGNLWIVDSRNHRIIKHSTAATKTNGANADGILGQANFTSNLQQSTQNGLDDPEGIAIGPDGSIWVSDDNNNRILRYENAMMKPNGSNADGVLGQPNFTSTTPQLTANGIEGASGLSVDCIGNLYAVDKKNNRLLVYQDASSKANGAAADYVLGQPDFTTGSPNLTESGLDFVATSGVTTYGNHLFIVDANHKRVIVQSLNYPMSNAALCGLNIPNGPTDDLGHIEPIPTMSEWGLFIFGLMVLNLGIFFVRRLEFG